MVFYHLKFCVLDLAMGNLFECKEAKEGVESVKLYEGGIVI